MKNWQMILNKSTSSLIMYQNLIKLFQWNKKYFKLSTESSLIIVFQSWNPFRTQLMLIEHVSPEKWKFKSIKKAILRWMYNLKRIFLSIYNMNHLRNLNLSKNVIVQSIFHTWWLFSPKMKIHSISIKEYKKCKK